MMLGREPNGVPVPVPPRERLDRVLRMGRVKLRAQDGTVTDSRVKRAFEGFHGRSGPLNAEGGVAARLYTAAGIEDVVTELDVLTGDILLIGAASVVTTNHTAVGRR